MCIFQWICFVWFYFRFLVTGAELWKGCTSVSNAGKKRGRGKMAGKGLTKDLNQGQIIGQGRKRLILPGLNTPVKRGSDIVRADRGADDPSWYVRQIIERMIFSGDEKN